MTAAPETMIDIARRIAAKHGLPGADAFRAPIRTRKFVYARQEAFHAIYATGRYSLNQIGQRFGRHHTTVLYAVLQHERRMKRAA